MELLQKLNACNRLLMTLIYIYLIY